MTPPDLSRAAFARVAPGSGDSDQLRHALESRVFHRVMSRVTAIVEEEVAALNAEGHAFTREEEALGITYCSSFDDGSQLRLELTISGACSARHLTAEQAAEEAPGPTEEERRFYAILERAREREREVGFGKLTADERLVYCLGSFEAELNNGGFEQYFINSAGDQAAETLRAMKKIGASRAAKFLTEASALFPEGKVPKDRDARIERVMAFTAAQRKALEKLDVQYAARAEYLPILAGVALRD